MDLKNGSFGPTWHLHTLEYSFALLQVLSEISRVLKDNGYLFSPSGRATAWYVLFALDALESAISRMRGHRTHIFLASETSQ
jgi:hypothetical protein